MKKQGNRLILCELLDILKKLTRNVSCELKSLSVYFFKS